VAIVKGLAPGVARIQMGRQRTLGDAQQHGRFNSQWIDRDNEKDNMVSYDARNLMTHPQQAL
jgi:hypothetical protein